ncbi:TonB-dependent receptor [Steroidobacter flavus]|uniref:TonB-dependent receptor n=1 Tax=Steroidobacter flavus TaxID=1842136 RepID=A0ABV8SMS7_9GAMM
MKQKTGTAGTVRESVRRTLQASVLATALGISATVFAQAAQPIQFNIPAQPLKAALKAFADQANMQLLYNPEVVDKLTAHPVRGEMPKQDALLRLLDGTNLEVVYSQDNAATIRPRQMTPVSSLNAGDARFTRTAAVTSGGPAEMSNASESSSSADTAEHESTNPALRGVPEILVMGSRSVNVDIVRTQDDAQAYYIFDSGKIEQSGAVNVEDFLKRGLSMNSAALTSSQQSANFRGNSSTINLRGLGDNQTLVLINGRRTASPGLFSGTYQPNLNSIPPSAIERIEVLPSSSAAIYGGSAVGGVVNVVLKRGFEGGDVRGTYANVMDGDAPTSTIGGSYGFSLEEGRTHISFSGLYSEGDTLTNADRPELLQRGVARIRQNNPTLLFSRTSPFFGATTNIGSATTGNLILDNGTPLSSTITSIPAGYTATSNPALLGTSAGSYNTNLPNTAHPTTGLRRSVGSAPELSTVMASFQREMTDSLNVFADFYWSSNTAVTSGYSSFNNVLTVPAASPINPFQQAVIVSIPDFYTDDYEAKSLDRRATVGFTLKLPAEWMLSSDYTWSESRMKYGGFIYSLVGMNADLLAGTLNPFVDTNVAPLDLSRYRGTFGSSQDGTLGDINVRVAGPVFDLPAGPAMLTIGLGYRKESLRDGNFHNQKPNYPNDSQYRKYFGQSQTIKSAYAEANIPLVSENMDIPAVRLLDAQLSVRTEDFSIGSGTPFQYVEPSAASFIATNQERVRFQSDLQSTNPTIGLRWKPIDDLTLRASYGTSFLPPTYSQLVPGNVSLVLSAGVPQTMNVIDPRRGNQLTTIEYTSGGNPNLKPQESKNVNVGLIFEPTFLPDFRMNVEWYRLEQDNVIVNPPNPNIILNNESRFGDRIERAPVQAGDPFGVGVLTFVDYSMFNANKAETEGVDLSMNYRLDMGSLGALAIGLGGTKVLSFKTQAALDAPMLDIVNQVAYTGPLQYRGNLSIGWSRNNWNAGWMTTYYGSYDQYNIGGVTTYTQAQGSNTIPSQMYHDIYAGYEFDGEGMLGGMSVLAGIKNVFDKTPPFDAYYLNSNYYSPFGDWRLRNYYLTLSKRF